MITSSEAILPIFHNTCIPL